MDDSDPDICNDRFMDILNRILESNAIPSDQCPREPEVKRPVWYSTTQAMHQILGTGALEEPFRLSVTSVPLISVESPSWAQGYLPSNAPLPDDFISQDFKNFFEAGEPGVNSQVDNFFPAPECSPLSSVPELSYSPYSEDPFFHPSPSPSPFDGNESESRDKPLGLDNLDLELNDFDFSAYVSEQLALFAQLQPPSTDVLNGHGQVPHDKVPLRNSLAPLDTTLQPPPLSSFSDCWSSCSSGSAPLTPNSPYGFNQDAVGYESQASQQGPFSSPNPHPTSWAFSSGLVSSCNLGYDTVSSDEPPSRQTSSFPTYTHNLHELGSQHLTSEQEKFLTEGNSPIAAPNNKHASLPIPRAPRNRNRNRNRSSFSSPYGYAYDAKKKNHFVGGFIADSFVETNDDMTYLNPANCHFPLPELPSPDLPTPPPAFEQQQEEAYHFIDHDRHLGRGRPCKDGGLIPCNQECAKGIGCTKTFQRKKDMQRHVSTSKRFKEVQCEYCGHSLSREDSLRKHQRTSCVGIPEEERERLQLKYGRGVQ